MLKAIGTLRINLLVLFLLASAQPSYCQVNLLNWPRIQFTDPLLEIDLGEFARVAQPQFIHLSIKKDPVDSGYIYKLYAINNFETVQQFNSSAWGQWRTYIILFYPEMGSEFPYHITSQSSPTSLKRYAEVILPKMVITLADGKTQQLIGSHGGKGPVIEFKLVNNREVYYYDRGGIPVREMPIFIPPAPEPAKKQ